jgi:hypothetical protein
MTLLIADVNANESDNLNDLDTLSPEDEASLDLLRDLDTGIAVKRPRLPPAQRDALNALIARAYRLSQGEPGLRDKLRALLRASLLNSHEQLMGELTFLLDFEWLLSRYLIRTWAELYGPETWMNALGDEFGSAGGRASRLAEQVKDPTTWTLGAMHAMAVTAASGNSDVGAVLTDELGQDWAVQIEVLLSLRNTLAHGRLREVGDLDDFLGLWGETIGELIGAASVYYRMEQIVTASASGHQTATRVV